MLTLMNDITETGTIMAHIFYVPLALIYSISVYLTVTFRYAII